MMPELRQPISLKEIFGRIRQVFLLKEDTSSADAGKERQIEGRDGALKVFLEEDFGSPTASASAIAEARNTLREEVVPWLKVIAFHLGELRGEHIAPRDIERYGE